jgi:hypothetical protein
MARSSHDALDGNGQGANPLNGGLEMELTLANAKSKVEGWKNRQN